MASAAPAGSPPPLMLLLQLLLLSAASPHGGDAAEVAHRIRAGAEAPGVAGRRPPDRGEERALLGSGGSGRGLSETYTCGGEASTFEGQHALNEDTAFSFGGSCDSYAFGLVNFINCDEDYDQVQMLYAWQVCHECGLCTHENRQCWSEKAALDASGLDCGHGYFDSTWCGVYDDSDFTASVICCECGGGERPVIPCVDTISGWQDGHSGLEGPFTCISYYAGDWCTRSGGYGFDWDPVTDGTFPPDASGLTAWDVCCACGGGMDATPTPAPAGWVWEHCEDYVPPGEERWHDSQPVKAGCFWYSIGYRCSYAQESYLADVPHFYNFGHSALEACCACGGGVMPCDDTDGRSKDANSMGCDVYALLPARCGPDSAPGPFDDTDFTSADMCCACGGGALPSSHGEAPTEPAALQTPAPTLEPGPCQGGSWAICQAEVIICEGELVIQGDYLLGCDQLVYLRIPDSVIFVHQWAFKDCRNLVRVDFGNGLVTIGGGAFLGTGITELSLPESVAFIETNGFLNCVELTKVVLPEFLTSLGVFAFAGAISMTEVVIGNHLEVIQASAFKYCISLTSLVLGSAVTKIGISAFENDYSLSEVVIPSKVTLIAERAFRKCLALAHLELGSGVTQIGALAFYKNVALGVVTMGDEVEVVGEEAFLECSSLSEVTMGSQVWDVGSRAFAECTALRKVIIGDAVVQLGSQAFLNCAALAQVVMGRAVVSVGDSAFQHCSSLQELFLHDKVTTIGSAAFDQCVSLSRVRLGRSLSLVGADVFRGCCDVREVIALSIARLSSIFECANVTNMTVADGISGKSLLGGCDHLVHLTLLADEVATYAFQGCEFLAVLTVGENLRIIGAGAFKDCTAIETIALDRAVESIGFEAFAGCTALRSVSLSAALDYIAIDAFFGCSSLQSAVIPSPFPRAVDQVFDCSKLVSVVVGPGVTHIGSRFLEGCRSLFQVSLPESVEEIGQAAFSGCANLSSVSLGRRVKNISASAFSGCASLGFVEFGSSLEVIESHAFSGCRSLVHVELPPSVSEIGSHAFEGCSSLEYMSIQGRVRSIEDRTFSGCSSLKWLEIPSSVTSIGAAAFLDCQALEYLGIPDNVTEIKDEAFRGCLSLRSMDVPESVREVGGHIFQSCSSIAWVRVPEVLLLAGMANAFEGCPNLSAVVIHDSALTVPAGAMKDLASLVSVAVPRGIESIGDRAFEDCSSLSFIQLPGRVKSIGSFAFSGCSSLTEIALSDSTSAIGSGAFFGCAGLVDIELPPALVSIESSAFSGCLSLASVHIPQSVEMIDDWAFSVSGLEDILIPDSVTTFGSGVFAESPSIHTVEVPASVLSRGLANVFFACPRLSLVRVAESVSSVPTNAFRGLSTLAKVELPSGVTSIGDSAFEGCSSLSSVTIPDTVTQVGSSAFSMCASLSSIKLGSSVRSVGSEAFFGCSGAATIQFGGALLFIGRSAFRGCSAVQDAHIPRSVVEVEDMAFAECWSLISIEVPVSVQKFGSQVFLGCPVREAILTKAVLTQEDAMISMLGGCSWLRVVNILDSVISMSPSAFQGCPAIRTVTAPAAVVNQGTAGIFGGCASVEAVFVMDGATSIGPSAFEGCSALSDVRIPRSLLQIGAAAFRGCASLARIDLPDGLKVIGDWAFSGCSSLSAVSIPESISFLGANAFEKCTSLSAVSVPTSLEATVAFEACPLVQSTDGRPYYTDAGRGCVRCPAESLVFFELTLLFFVLVCLFIMLLVFGWVAATSDAKSVSRANFCAVAQSLLLGLQTLQVAIQDVPWPPRLATVLEVFGFVSLRIDRVQPECQNIAVSIFARTIMVLYGFPIVLASCYVCMAVGRSLLEGEFKGRLCGYMKLGCRATLSNLHWMTVILLQWSWQWAGCGFLTVLVGDQERPTLLVGDRMDLRCELSEAHWVRLAIASLPPLFVFQFGVPALLLWYAREPAFTFATAAYKSAWKRTWLCVDILYKTALVVCRIAFLSKVDEPWVHGRIQVRSWVLLSAALAYHAALVHFRPYQRRVMVAADGALFYSILASGTTLVCYTVATPWWIGVGRATPHSGGRDPWEEPQDEMFVASDSALVVVLEIFLTATLIMWLGIAAWVLLRYSTLLTRITCQRFALFSSERDEEKELLAAAHHDPHAAGRRDLGTFTPGAAKAVISAPGAVARSFDVMVNCPGKPSRLGVLVEQVNGAPPIVKKDGRYLVRFAKEYSEGEVVEYEEEEEEEEADVQEEVEGQYLKYAGEAEYEFWHKACGRITSLRSYSFACVWIPGIQGCTRPAASHAEWETLINPNSGSALDLGPMIGAELWYLYQETLQWIHDELAATYQFPEEGAPCAHCGWFDFWAVNVMRCYQDGQQLHFAALGLPMYEGQPVFHCVWRNTYHYVGKAQKVELEWTTMMMGMEVTPVSFEEEVLGGENSQMRLLGPLMALARQGVSDYDAQGLYSVLDKFMEKQNLADARRLQNKALIRVALGAPFMLGLLRIYAGLQETQTVMANITASIGLLLVLGAAACWVHRDRFFEGLEADFALADAVRADRFHDHVLRRFCTWDAQQNDLPQNNQLQDAQQGDAPQTDLVPPKELPKEHHSGPEDSLDRPRVPEAPGVPAADVDMPGRLPVEL